MRITNFPKGLYDELCILYQMTKGGSQASLVFWELITIFESPSNIVKTTSTSNYKALAVAIASTVLQSKIHCLWEEKKKLILVLLIDGLFSLTKLYFVHKNYIKSCILKLWPSSSIIDVTIMTLLKII